MDIDFGLWNGPERNRRKPPQGSSLRLREKSLLERLFRMGGGYVLDFSDRTFEEFFAEEANVEIYGNSRYDWGPSTSKANLLRAFWHVEPDRVVAKVLDLLIDRAVESGDARGKPEPEDLVEQCRRIVTRLRGDDPGLDDLIEISSVETLPQLERVVVRIREAIPRDPALAIGSAKDLVESVCKTILRESASGSPEPREFLPLLRAARKELGLVPEGVPESRRGKKTIQKILGSLGTVGQGVAELRNLYGTGHGRHGRERGLQERHAKLAVGSAVTLAVFLFETHAARRAEHGERDGRSES